LRKQKLKKGGFHANGKEKKIGKSERKPQRNLDCNEKGPPRQTGWGAALPYGKWVSKNVSKQHCSRDHIVGLATNGRRVGPPRRRQERQKNSGLSGGGGGINEGEKKTLQPR